MFVISLLFILSAILPQDMYASASNIEALVNSPKVSLESFRVNALQDQEEDTLSAADPDPDSEGAIEPLDRGIAVGDASYIYGLVTVSCTGTFLLVLIIMLLSYRVRFPSVQSHGLVILFAVLLLINCFTFFLPDIVGFNDFMPEASPYIWYGSLSLAIHLLPFLIALTFDMRSSKRSSIHLVWLSAVPLILIYLELGYHVEYLAGASAVVAFLVLYFLQRANRKKKNGVNHLLNGSLATFIFLILYLLNSEGAIDLEMPLYYIVIALMYVILPLSFTFCIPSRHISSFSKTENDQEELAVELKAASSKLLSLESQLAEKEQLAYFGQRALKIVRKIKNPLELVNNYSDVSLGLIERAREEIKNSLYLQDESGQHILRLLHKTDDSLQNVQKQGSQISRLIKGMFQQPGEDESKRKRPTDFNGLIKEYVNLAGKNLRNGKNPIDVEIEMNLDKNVGSVSLYTEDFSRVILSLCKNAFDAMRFKMGISDVKQGEFQRNTGYSMKNYTPRLSVETKREGRKVSLEMKYNASEVPSEAKYENLQALFESKNDAGGPEPGLSEIHGILRAHDSEILIIPFGNGTSVHIELKG